MAAKAACSCDWPIENPFSPSFFHDSTLKGSKLSRKRRLSPPNENGRFVLSLATAANFRALGLDDEGASEVLKRVGILAVDDLKVSFRVQEGVIEAVRGVSFRVPKGTTVALVGESDRANPWSRKPSWASCRKPATASTAAVFFFRSRCQAAAVGPATKPSISPDLIPMAKRDTPPAGTGYRSSFQEPMTSLCRPLHHRRSGRRSLALHRTCSAAALTEFTQEMLRLVGFPILARLAHLSVRIIRWIRQRAMIAMALVCRPALLIADELIHRPGRHHSSADLKLIRDLQSELQMAVLVIAHDLGVVANMAENRRGCTTANHGAGTRDHIFRNPQHPLSKALPRPCRGLIWGRAKDWCRSAKLNPMPIPLMAERGPWSEAGRSRGSASVGQRYFQSLHDPQQRHVR